MDNVTRNPRKNDSLQLQRPKQISIESVADAEDGTPRIRWVGEYENEHGQVFHIRVIGARADVEAYVRNLRLALLALPLNRSPAQELSWTRNWRAPTWAAPPKPEQETPEEPDQDEKPAPDQRTHDRIITILAHKIGNIKPPYRLLFTLDPEIVEPGATDWYPFTSGSGTGLSETTRADTGWVKSTLYQAGVLPVSREVDSFLSTPRLKKRTMDVPRATDLCLGVRNQWSGHTSTYTLTGEVVTGVNVPQAAPCA